MRLVGLDFETANNTFGSICAAGCAILEDGEVVEKREWLIRPHRRIDRMHAACFAVHGISWYDLRDVPEFPAIWPVLRRMLTSGGLVVVHNASFDLTHLQGGTGHLQITVGGIRLRLQPESESRTSAES